MKIVKTKGGNEPETLGVCMCDAQLSVVDAADPECVCYCDGMQGDSDIKLENKYVLSP